MDEDWLYTGDTPYDSQDYINSLPDAGGDYWNTDFGGDWYGGSSDDMAQWDSNRYDGTADQGFWGNLAGGAGNLLSGAGRFLTSPQGASTIANLGGGYLNRENYSDAARISGQAQIEAARIAADAAKFRPVGVTTSFGQSKFGYDDQGRLNQAGYELAPGLQAQQDSLMGASNPYLQQFLDAQGATAPMAQGAQGMFNLGQQYLGTDPQAQAQKYMADQQALLAPGRASEMASLQATMQAQGRGGFSMGGDAGMGASNPQMQALLNSQRMQDLGLASQATQGGMDYAKFGAGMMGSGGNMLRDMYSTQSGAYDPYQTAMGGAQYLEGLGQNAMDMGTQLGGKVTAGNAAGGLLLGQAQTNAATNNQEAQQTTGSTWGNLLQGAAPMLSQYNWGS